MTSEEITQEMGIIIDGASNWFNDIVVTSKAIDDYLDKVKGLLKDEHERTIVRKIIEERFYQIMEGELTVLSDDDDHEEWFNPGTGLPFDLANREVHFWKYYKEYLYKQGKMGKSAISEIDSVTNQIMSKLVDPRNPKDIWAKRGLVMGSVQSGKTGNYTGLIAKAIDNEYKFIIILSGQHKDLRAQTQLRINEELLGYDTKNNLQDSSKLAGNRIGVGLLDKKHKGISVQTLTTSDVDGDFKKKTAESVNPILDGKRTYVLIIKKEKSVMLNLIEWLENSPHAVDGKIRDVPLLLIDDECDQASIDTNPKKKRNAIDEDGFSLEDPTVTNKRIRNLLNIFSKSVYVGYSATPFANIFINSVGKKREIGEDLFPKNFIFSLKRPSSYVGPEEYFGLRNLRQGGSSNPKSPKSDDENISHPMENVMDDEMTDPDSSEDSDEIEFEETDPLPLQRPADDAEDIYKKKHKKDLVVPKLPTSMLNAVKSFLLTIAARKIRETSNPHSSMLAHVSRFAKVHETTRDLLHGVLQDYVSRINVPSEPLDDFKKIWEEDFQPTTAKVSKIANASSLPNRWGALSDIPWEKIRQVLPIVSTRVDVKVINGTSDDVLDYATHQNKHGKKANWEERGIHVIVVGGDKLSRGLTLEGLTVSYYLRATNMYDTLMQMGRWFGYRNGFLDLCRLYSTKEIFVNFSLVATAEKDLRDQLALMQKKGKTPMEFGLYVLQSPGNLIVTSLRKQGSAKKISINFGGCGPETTMFAPSQREHNWNTLKDLITQLDGKATMKTNSKNLHWTGVSKNIVAKFLQDYSAHKGQETRNNATAKFILNQNNNILKTWDVVFVRYDMKSKNPKSRNPIIVNANGKDLHVVHRKATEYDEQRLYVRRIGGPTDETADLTPQELAELKKKYGKKNLTGAQVRSVRDISRGLLLIYLIADPNGVEHPYGGPKDKYPSNHHYIGYIVSFPEDKSNLFKAEEILANDIWSV